MGETEKQAQGGIPAIPIGVTEGVWETEEQGIEDGATSMRGWCGGMRAHLKLVVLGAKHWCGGKWRLFHAVRGRGMAVFTSTP